MDLSDLSPDSCPGGSDRVHEAPIGAFQLGIGNDEIAFNRPAPQNVEVKEMSRNIPQI